MKPAKDFGSVGWGPTTARVGLVLGLVLSLMELMPGPSLAGGAADSTRGRLDAVDALGNVLPAGPCPQRIVSLSPNITEILFAVGVDSSRIVGVTRFCDYPPAASRRPQVGGIVDPSPEVIVSRQPDLVLAVRGNPRPLLGQLGRLGLPVFAFDDRTGLKGVADLVAAVAAISCPERPARADSLVAWYRSVLVAYQDWSSDLDPADRPTVYYADPDYPTWTAGAGSHIDDLIHLAGGANIAASLPGWPQMSLEQIVLDQPRYLLLAVPSGRDTESVYKELAGKPGWSSLSALRDRTVCWIPAARLQRPGPRLVGVLEELAACLHPDRPRPFSAGAGQPKLMEPRP